MRYVDSQKEKPIIGKWVMGRYRSHLMENDRGIFQWTGTSWGAHVSLTKWRYLSLIERLKVNAGILKTHRSLGAK